MEVGELMTRTSPLGEYILTLLEDQNLSMREASMRAGLAPETVSQIIRRGKSSTPRPDTLKLIASALGGNYQYMMILAGHLSPAPAALDQETRARLEELARKLALLDPAERERITRQYLTLLDFALSLKGVEETT